MCGIAGIIGRTGPADPSLVERMNAIQHHRGPDASGVKAVDGAVLGHVRLSIIDLSDRAAQPMASADGRHVLVFNGEIYNYVELRAELCAGHAFRSDSDTEVLLAAWRRWGEDCLDRLNGMFAFCVYDTADGSAFFARDRFGQKPLHLAERDGRLYFSSEVKALLAAGIEARADLDTWGRYLTTASYDDTAQTFFAGITQLLPGECARFVPGRGLSRRHYYRLSEHCPPLALDEAAAAPLVRDVMVDACRIHMRSDVPVGVMLSGGLDSSTMLAGFELAGALHSGVKCFSVDFGPDLSERRWIEPAAAHHALPVQIDSFTPERFAATMRPMMWHLEGPIGGLMNNALTEVMQAARGQGFVVLQDGTGSDEAYGGYRNHHNLYLALLLQAGRADADQRAAEYAATWGVDVAAAKRAAEQELARVSTYTAIDGTVPVRPEAFARAVTERPLLAPADLGTTGNPLRDSLLHYLQGSKVPRNTRMLDRLSMAYSIELRLPFLDHRFIELGLSLPADLYFLEGRTKGIIRSAFRGVMDDDVRLAIKRSIQAPQGLWLRSEPMVSYVEGLIASDSFASRGLFDVDACKKLFARFKAGEFDNSFFVWQWINVEEWFRTFVDVDSFANRAPLYH